MIDHEKCEHSKDYNSSQNTMKSAKVEEAKAKHLLDIIAERLGCDCISSLKLPQYRDRALRELRDGQFNLLKKEELFEAIIYLDPPMKTLLFGTGTDKRLLLEWQGGQEYFADVILCGTYDEYVAALKEDAYQLYVCMVDGDVGFEAVKAARAHCPGKPMMWFPVNNDHTLDTFRYGCVLCGMQKQMNATHLIWAMDRCRMKLHGFERE